MNRCRHKTPIVTMHFNSWHFQSSFCEVVSRPSFKSSFAKGLSMHEDLGEKPDMAPCTCNPRAGEVETGGGGSLRLGGQLL